jgi:deoxyribose-phosphate aldolase
MSDPSAVSMNDISRMIDHSLLHPTMTDGDILAGCELAEKFHTATVCVKPYAVALARDALAGSDVKVCSVIGFPHGNSLPALKVAETSQAIGDGAAEIDMVINIGKALGGQWDYVAGEIRAVNDACRAGNAILKVIFETDFLPDDTVIRLCEICSQIRVAFVKTSTGYGFVKQPDGNYTTRGATDHFVSLMRARSDPAVQVKAAGGIRTLDVLLHFRSLGVTRIGATATESMLAEARRRGIV